MNKQAFFKLLCLIGLVASHFMFIALPAQALLPIASNPVSAGSISSCVIRAADDLYCVGANSYGQLGNGSLISTTDPQKVVGISNVSAVSVGKNSACAVTHGGSLYCWGDNTFGQLGLGDTQSRSSATLVPSITNVSQVAVGDNFACALTTNSVVSCWGANDTGQLTTDSGQANSIPSIASQIPTGISQISVSGKRVCVVAAEVYCWGDFASFIFPNETRNWVPIKVAGSVGAKLVELGIDFGCFTLASSLSCWGSNDHGQLGVGNRVASATPLAVTGISSVKDFSLGNHFACVIDSSNETYCWGDNRDGQLVVSAKTDQLTRIPTGAPKAVSLDAGSNNLCVLKLDAAVVCYGDSSSGQSGYLLSSSSPLTNAKLASASKFATGLNTTCTIDSLGYLQCWGELIPVVPVGLTFIAVAVGDSSACAVTSTKKVFCWGSNSAGQLGNNTTRSSLEISEIASASTSFTKVSVGYRHACASTEDGLAYCWGDNLRHQLGSIGADSRIPKAVPGIGTASAIFSGDYYNCVLQIGGSVTCWGDNSKKQINSSGTNLLAPTALILDNSISGIALGPANTCLLDVNKSLRCIGDNAKKASPGLVAGNYLEIATGGNTVCAINIDEKVFCFGSAQDSKLGVNTADTSAITKMSDEAFVRVSVGAQHVCAIDKTSKLSCWGSNASGQLTSSFGFPKAFADLSVLVSGNKAVGEVISATFSGQEAKVTYSYLWKRVSTTNGLASSLTSELGPDYLISGSDLGKFFAIEMKQSKWGTTSIGYLSQFTIAIGTPIRLLLTPVPTVSGTTKVGRILTARTGSWDSGVKLNYQWYRGKSAIKGAIKASYSLTSVDVGKQLYVAVTGSKSGVPKVITKSAKSVKIVR